MSVERATEYSAEEAGVTLQLHRALHPQIAADDKLAFIHGTIVMPVLEVLFEMERTGVLVDAALFEAQGQELGRCMLEIEQQAHVVPLVVDLGAGPNWKRAH